MGDEEVSDAEQSGGDSADDASPAVSLNKTWLIAAAVLFVGVVILAMVL